MSGAEETLQRIEELLALLLESIRRLERRLDSLSLTEEASVAYELASLFSLPTSAAIEAAKKLLSVLGFSSHIGLMCFHRIIFLPPHPARGFICLGGVRGHPGDPHLECLLSPPSEPHRVAHQHDDSTKP